MRRTMLGALSAAAVLVAGLVAAPASAGPLDLFLKIDGVKGDATAVGQAGAIRVEGYELGGSSGSSALSPAFGAGKVTMAPLKVRYLLDGSWPPLFLGLASGKRFPQALLTLRRAGTTSELLTIKLENVLVVGLQQDSNAGNIPTVMLTLSFVRISIDYKGSNARGRASAGVKAAWDFAMGKQP